MDTMNIVETDPSLEGSSSVFEIGRVMEETKGDPIADHESDKAHPGDMG